MALTRSVLVSTPFKLQVGNVNVRLNYQELSKIMTDADGELRDYLADGDEHV